MSFIEKLKMIERLDQLIRMQATGSPTKLAERLGVARSTVYEVIDCMRSIGAPIQYDKKKQSFYYSSNEKLFIGYFDQKKDLKKQ